MIYDLIFIVFTILYLPYFLLSGKWRGFSRQRLGDFTADELARIAGSNSIWLHAVSVGEVIASVPLYEEIRKNLPGEKIIVSTVTATGNKIARERFKDAVAIIYLPLDLSGFTDKAVNLIKPKAALIAETEIWPNFISSLKKNGAGIVIFNGRISPNSFKNYNMVKSFLKNVLQKVDLFLMQSQADADKIVSLGAPKDNVRVTGNLKYDAALMRAADQDASILRKKLGLEGAEKLLIAGSTNPGEEEKILRCCKDLIPEFPELRLLLAPRHTDRAAIASELARKHGFISRFVSTAGTGPLEKNEILILDVMGVLARFYAAADIVFIGGSLVNKGGQNPLEAAYHSKPILFGRYMHNFESIAANLVSAGGALKVDDEAALTNSLRALLRNDSRCRQMGDNARGALESGSGTAKRDIEFIKKLISK